MQSFSPVTHIRPSQEHVLPATFVSHLRARRRQPSQPLYQIHCSCPFKVSSHSFSYYACHASLQFDGEPPSSVHACIINPPSATLLRRSQTRRNLQNPSILVLHSFLHIHPLKLTRPTFTLGAPLLVASFFCTPIHVRLALST